MMPDAVLMIKTEKIGIEYGGEMGGIYVVERRIKDDVCPMFKKNIFLTWNPEIMVSVLLQDW